MALAAALPPLLLSKAMSWFVIAAELALAAGLATPRLYRWVLPGGILFHTGMLVFTGGEVSWLFPYAIWAGFVAVAPWPDLPLEARVRGRRGAAIRRVLGRLDVEGLYRWRSVDPESTDGRQDAVTVPSRETDGTARTAWTGPAAVLLLLLVNSVVHALGAVLVLWEPLPAFLARTLLLIRGGG